MAKHSHSILELAKKGATHRYQELKEEITALVKHFPHLSSLGRVSHEIDLSSEPAGTIGLTQGRHRRMSAAARKKISEAQKKRWAARRSHKMGRRGVGRSGCKTSLVGRCSDAHM